MHLHEIEAEALKLPRAAQRYLVHRLMYNLSTAEPEGPSQPVSIEDDPIWGLGQNPVDGGVTDAAVNHDHYGSPKRDARDG